jgi:hypothetical protein
MEPGLEFLLDDLSPSAQQQAVCAGPAGQHIPAPDAETHHPCTDTKTSKALAATAQKKRRKNRFLLTTRKNKKSSSVSARRRREEGFIPAYVGRFLISEDERVMYRTARKAADAATHYRKLSPEQRKEAGVVLKSLHAHFSIYESAFQNSPKRQRMVMLEDVLWRSCLHLGIRFEIGTAMQQLDLLEAEINTCN